MNLLRLLNGLSCIAMFAVAVFAAATASRAEVRFLLRPDTGEAQIYNAGELPVVVSNYLLESPSKTLQSDDWTPIADRLDAGGDASFDSAGNWIVFPTAMPGGDLSEGVFNSPGGTLDSLAMVSLGTLWNTANSQDFLASAVLNDIAVSLDVVETPPGDYDWDGDVDPDDYLVFRETYGSTEDLRADGNDNGMVDASDYTVWRNAIFSPPTGAGAAEPPIAVGSIIAVVPEPATAGLVAVIATWTLATLRRRRSR